MKKDKGTGLGLSICLQMVKEHKGKIEIESEPGKGTTCTIILPSQEVNSELIEQAEPATKEKNLPLALPKTFSPRCS